MFGSSRRTLAALLTIVLVVPVVVAAAFADKTTAQKPINVEKEWRGGSQDAKDNDAWQQRPFAGVVLGPKAWEWLWKEWRIDAARAAIDFEKELVLVAAGPGPNTIATNLTLHENGNLELSTSITEKEGPGFVFVIQKINRAGIKTVNGKPIGVEPKKDAKTGFVVGGKNDTGLIKKLTEINGFSMAELEKKMRPQGLSKAGFLGQAEKLAQVLADDNALVVDQLGLTHQELARHLLLLADVGKKDPFMYLGRKFRVTVIQAKNTITSPFMDGTKTNSDVTVHNLDSNKKLQFSLLVPLMIERYGFYEGQETSYRVDPLDIVEVLDFLTKKIR